MCVPGANDIALNASRLVTTPGPAAAPAAQSTYTVAASCGAAVADAQAARDNRNTLGRIKSNSNR
jgi:hypothetical protein